MHVPVSRPRAVIQPHTIRDLTLQSSYIISYPVTDLVPDGELIEAHAAVACRAVVNGEMDRAPAYSGVEKKVEGILIETRAA